MVREEKNMTNYPAFGRSAGSTLSFPSELQVKLPDIYFYEHWGGGQSMAENTKRPHFQNFYLNKIFKSSSLIDYLLRE